MSPTHQAIRLPQGLGMPMSDGQGIPTAVRDEFLSLLKRADAFAARLHRDCFGRAPFPLLVEAVRD